MAQGVAYLGTRRVADEALGLQSWDDDDNHTSLMALRRGPRNSGKAVDLRTTEKY